jgi:hypothetical protein
MELHQLQLNQLKIEQKRFFMTDSQLSREWLIKFLKKNYLAIFCIVLLSPSYYDLTAKIHPANELQKTEGELVFIVHGGMYGYSTGIRTPDGASQYFSCKGSWGRKNNCLPANITQQSVQGKKAAIMWFRQPAFLWTHKNRLVELRVEDKVIISRENTQSQIDSDFKWDIGWIISFILIIIGIKKNIIKI